MADSWQRIETAPKDGTQILGFTRGNCVVVEYKTIPDGSAFWEFAVNQSTGASAVLNTPLTHWQPLPDPPSLK